MAGKKEDELAIDFSRITSFFKKKPAKGAESPPEGKEDLSIDLESAKKFLKRHHVLLLILIPLTLSIFFRAQTFYLPQTDAWAEDSVQSYYKSQLAGQINRQYPNLPASNKEQILQQELSNYIQSHRSEYENQVEQTSNHFRSKMQDSTGQTYLLAIDPYQWYRYGGDIIEHGHMGDKLVNGTPHDMHMLAPEGKPVSRELHPYLGAYLYKIINPITGTNLMGAFFLLPVLLMSLAVIPAFFVGRKLGGNIAGFFASLVVAVHPAVLTRTMGGFSDTDAYTVLFPLAIFWLFIEAAEAGDYRKKAAYAGLAGLCTGIFAFAWYGWWYIFDFVIGAAGIYIAYLIISEYLVKKKRLLNDLKSDRRIRSMLAILLVFFISSALFVMLFTNANNFAGAAIEKPLSVIRLKEAAKATLWPNVYTTVAEMNQATFSNIMDTMGGKLLFIIGIAGVFLVLMNITGSENRDRKTAYFVLLALWFFGALYASTKGIRFTIILTPAYALGFGVVAAAVYYRLSRIVSKGMNLNINIVKAIFIIAPLLILIPTLSSAANTAGNEVPSMNDAWHTSLTNIKGNSSEDAIINSWWDFGHWFKAIADRPVTFDGASQNKPQAHWIGRTLLTSDEDEAVGILRMLDCGANSAFELLYNKTGKAKMSVDIIYEIIKMDRGEAKKVLADYVTEEEAEKILKNTHCQPPENFFITSEDMVGKAGVWAHFGSWDFDKAKIWRDYRKKKMDAAVSGMMEEFNYSREKAEKTYYDIQALSNEQDANTWISPWPGYISNTQCSKESNTTIMCTFNVQKQQLPVKVNVSSEDAYIETGKGRVRPKSLSYINSRGGFTVKEFKNSTLPYSMALSVRPNRITGVLMFPELSASMFTRLFYFDGAGLEHFDFFDYQKSFTGQEIFTWKVDWDGKSDSAAEAGYDDQEEDLGEEVVTNPPAREILDSEGMLE